MKHTGNTSLSPQFNIFAHSDFGLDTLQARIFTVLLENITDCGELAPVRIRAEEVLGPNPTPHHYMLLDEALDALAGKRLREPGKSRRCAMYLPLFEYLACGEDGFIEALFSGRVRTALEYLVSNFSMREIRRFVQLRHSHAQRLFWYVRGHVDERWVLLSLEQLKDVMLGVRKYRHKDAEYERYYDFKTRVVDQAIKTLRDEGLLDIRYREVRVNRIVDKLNLRVNYCSPATPPSPEGTRQLVLF